MNLLCCMKCVYKSPPELYWRNCNCLCSFVFTGECLESSTTRDKLKTAKCLISKYLNRKSRCQETWKGMTGFLVLRSSKHGGILVTYVFFIIWKIVVKIITWLAIFLLVGKPRVTRYHWTIPCFVFFFLNSQPENHLLKENLCPSLTTVRWFAKHKEQP